MKWMMTFLLIFLLLSSMNMPAASASHEDNNKSNVSLPDSLITDDYVYEYTFSDFDKAERIMQELRKRKKLPNFRLDMVEGDLYFNTGSYYRALKYYKWALDSDSVQSDNSRVMEQIHRMISCYDCLHNEVRKAQYVEKLLKKAKECGDKAMQSVAMFNMGKMLYHQGNKDKGYKYMYQAVDLMEKTDYTYKYDNLRYNYNTLLVFQEQDRRNEEALRTLELLQKVVAEATGAETQMEGLSEKEKKAMYSHYAVVLFRLGRKEEAESYYKRFLSAAKAYDRDNYLVMPYLFDRKMYDEVIRMNSAREKILSQQGDTITYHMTTIKRSLGQAYEEKGDYSNATRYFKELAVLRDSIKNREQKSSALELAALYETQEKDMIIQKQVADVGIRNLWLVLIGCIAFLMGVILWCAIRYNRKIRSKNEALVENIGELLGYKDELYRKKDENMALQKEIVGLKEKACLSLQLQDKIDSGNEAGLLGEPVNIDPDMETDMGDEEEAKDCNDAYAKALFDRIELLLISKQLYLDSDFSREKLAKFIYIPRNRFAPLFKQYANTSFSRYLNDLRLDHAARLLLERPEFSIESIAKECGIPAPTSFYRLFLERFKVTPMDFRKRKKRVDND